MIRAERTAEGWQVQVQAEVTIYQVAELHALAQPWLEAAAPWQLDLSQVDDIDGAGLQWLLHLQRSLGATGHGLSVQQPSPAVQQLLQLCPGTGLAPVACP